MPVTAFVGAAVGAAVGALVWGLIASWTGYEIGYIAWGIGALVGILAARFGAEGAVAGTICAVLALASIFAGKVAGAHFSTQKEIGKLNEKMFTPLIYQQQTAKAAAFAQLKSEQEWPDYMIQHGYTEAKKESGIRAEEMSDFRKDTVPYLRNLHSEKPTYDAWRKKMMQKFTLEVKTGDLIQAVVKNLNLIDIIFGLLGLVTAFKLGCGGKGKEPEAQAKAPAQP